MNNIFAMLNQLKQNPMAMLAKKFKLPQELPNDPQKIVEYLVGSGQISQEQVDQAMEMKKQFLGN